MPESYRQLVFRPQQVDSPELTAARLATVLANLGIIGDKIPGPWPHRYLIGDTFLQNLSFMGCAPALEFQPTDTSTTPCDWSSFTFVLVTPLFPQARLLVDTQMARPTCPLCGKRQHVNQLTLQPGDRQVTCIHCVQTSPAADWGWREFGGWSRIFFSIANVYPKESIPTDSFMQKLQATTSVPWQYFYINDEFPDSNN